MGEQPEDESKPDEEEDDVTTDDEADTDGEDADTDVEDADTDLDNEPSKEIEDLDSEAGDDTDTSMDDLGTEPAAEEGIEDEDVMDMTGASDDEVLKVFKAMKPEDGIVVKKDGNNVEFADGQDEYIIKLDSEETPDVDSEMDTDMGSEMDTDFGDETSDDTEMDETLYEIELGEEEEEEEEEEVKEEDESKEVEASEGKVKEVEVGEAARTLGNDVRKPADQGKKYKAGRHEMNEEVEKLKKQNSEYKKALILFKDKLNEVAVFNANLAYATRLFTEHSTTKQEKLNILKRFDSISSMNEAKTLFNTIKTELGTKTTVTESVVEKITNTPSTSTSTEVLAESKAYENPQFKRMKDLMTKIK
jgi:hypothetical protein